MAGNNPSPTWGLVADISRNIFYLSLIATPLLFFFLTRWWPMAAVVGISALVIRRVAKRRLL